MGAWLVVGVVREIDSGFASRARRVEDWWFYCCGGGYCWIWHWYACCRMAGLG